VNYDYLVTGEMTKVRENGATSGVGVLAAYAYDNLGRRTSVTFGNGVVQAYTYDPVSRLASLTNDLGGTANDLGATFDYNPASQIAGNVRTGDAYAFAGHANGSTPYYHDGRNQLGQIGFADTAHDARGNLTSDPTSGKSYTYLPSTNQLWTVSSPWTSMSYDPLDRLAIIVGSSDAKFAYDGLDTLAEYDGSDVLQRRYVFGPGVDEPIVQYEGSGTSSRRFLSADERGSIISATDSAGGLIAINRHDEYGMPQSGNVGRFQYTGQMWLPEAGLYHYKARSYAPHLGRFLQTEPIGYDAGPNLYAYVLNDPMNLVDPLGLGAEGPNTDVLPYNPGENEIFVTGERCWTCQSLDSFAAQSMYDAALRSSGIVGENDGGEIIVTGTRPKPTPPPRPTSNVLPPAFLVQAGGRERGNYCTGVPDQPMGVDISEACRQHDECYAPGSGTSRGGCDSRLGQDIYDACRRQGGDQAACFALAEIYYLGVRALGAGFYHLPRIWRHRGIQ
jgi:RHS repeat-associated protein